MRWILEELPLLTEWVRESTYNKVVTSRLYSGLRAMYHAHIGGDAHRLIYEAGELVGGYTLHFDGYLEGLFSVRKGFGGRILDMQIEATLKVTDEALHTYCFNVGPLPQLLRDRGFREIKRAKWDSRLAPKYWDSATYGMPDIVYFQKG